MDDGVILADVLALFQEESGGDHWRKGDSDGTKIGDHVAKWALKRYFQPIP